ncbi:hypothetical protein NP233_g2039 [Leucocoprinus birnbaumii]|uniref:Uncharacterized protein n=1 Tax=Leucocoprinus birnbaumii TaxID=56174 RepID=A0AAD5VYY9_9AGAR|nr:hypothetical protein NP233_g2039 [Leucocoprinus birnbaumii]
MAASHIDAQKATKKRKLTDKNIPNAILQNPEFLQDSQMYQSLLDMERKLDWTMTRKKVEVQDALSRIPSTTRTLRIFLSHSTSGQAWQTGSDSITPNVETGEGIPAWSFKVEGRLLEPLNHRSRDKNPQRKFSTLIKRMIIEIERDPALYPESNIVEWPRAPGQHNPSLDGFTVRRTGDAPTKLRVIMFLDHFPEQYKLSPELSHILGIKEESRLGVIQTLWNYIKLQGLQDKTDRRMIHADEKLRAVFGAETIAFQQIPELVNRHLGGPEPVVLHYLLNPTQPPPERPMAWDVEIKMEDSSLKNRMATSVQMSKESMATLMKLDEEIGLLAQSLHNSHLKRTFLQAFADDPAKFIQTWLESQSRDLETILGSGPTEGMTVRQEELRRSEFFQLPWVEEVSTYKLLAQEPWAGEVMSSKDNKMFVSDEFKNLETEIEMRKNGLSKIQYASEAYHHSLSKKKQYDGIDSNEKLLSLDALGLVMIVHGEEFSESSVFGGSLVKFGRAHCKVATLQEAYAVTFKDTFIASLERFSDGIKEYEHLSKKLESRRSAYENAYFKAEKLRQSKKEKERLEAEEELDRSKQRFDETAEDIRAHMEMIRSDDALHLRELTAFLDLEINFAQQYLEVLKDVKADWSSETSSPTKSNRRNGITKPLSRRSSKNAKSPIDNQSTPESSEDEDSPRTASGRRHSFRGENGSGSKPPSRPTSRLSRKRTNSNATATSEKDKEAAMPQHSRRRSVAGWASNAVESVANRMKKDKDKDNFASLDDEDEGSPAQRNSPERVSPLKKSSSIGSIGRRSSFFSSPKAKPQLPSKISATPGKKIVRARVDYEAKSTNELSFTAGSEIVVLNEVLDSWWMGELNNRRGLFPTTHIDVIHPSTSPPLPPPQTDKRASPSLLAAAQQPRMDVDAQSLDDGYGTSELDEEKDLTRRPLEHSPFIEAIDDTHSIVSLATDDDEDRIGVTHTPKQKARALPDTLQSSHSRSASSSPPEPVLLSAAGFLGRNNSSSSYSSQSTSTPGKKVPPPPPPRRNISNVPVIAPPIPERKINTSGGSAGRGYYTSGSGNAGSGTTSSSSSVASLTVGEDRSRGGSSEGEVPSVERYDRSPFESTLDLSAPSPPQLPARPNVEGGGKTNPFRSG